MCIFQSLSSSFWLLREKKREKEKEGRAIMGDKFLISWYTWHYSGAPMQWTET